MKTIKLTKGYETIVDDEDYEYLSKHKWTAVITGQNIKRVYGYRRFGSNGTTKLTIYIHRQVINAADGFDVDHINGDTLDNRKTNLRLATRSQNLANGRKPVGVAGFRGVTIDYRDNGIIAQCCGYIGRFPTIEDAARAYDTVAIKKFGKFAKLNFPNELPR